MASVGSDFSYLQRTLEDSHRAIRDVEQQKEEETQRLRKARDEDVQRVEKDYQVLLREQRDASDATIREHQKSSKADFERERELSKGQYAEVKRQVYDRYGKMVENDLAEGRAQLERAQVSLAEAAQGTRRNNASIDETYQNRLREIAEESNLRGDEAAERARESAMEAYRNTYEGDKAEYISQKKELSEKYAKLTQEVLDRIHSERQQLEHAQKQTELDFKHREDSLRKSSDGRVDAIGKHYDRRAQEAILSQKRSFEASQKDLRSQMGDLLDLARDYNKGRAEGREESIREFEDQVRTKERMLLDQHDTELTSQKEAAVAHEERMSERHAEQLSARDKRFARLVRQINQENRNRETDLVKQYSLAQTQLKDQMDHDRMLASQNAERIANSAVEQNQRAMQSQAQAYQKTMEDQRLDLNSQLKSLEQQLRDSRSSTDPNNITPAAEASVRRLMQNEYQKLHDAEVASSQKQVEGIRLEYTQALDETRDAAKVREQELVHEKALSDDQSRAAFFNYSSEVETAKQQSIRTLESDHDREMQQLARNFALSMMNQERATKESVKSLIQSYESKLMAIRDDARFKENMVHRQHNMDQAELVKGYDRRLDDTVQDYEIKLEEMRREVAQTKMDVERRSRQVLDEQQRAYEHQIAQLKQQQAEREKTIAMNYEDQLESMRRSNARLAQKKG